MGQNDRYFVNLPIWLDENRLMVNRWGGADTSEVGLVDFSQSETHPTETSLSDSADYYTSDLHRTQLKDGRVVVSERYTPKPARIFDVQSPGAFALTVPFSGDVTRALGEHGLLYHKENGEVGIVDFSGSQARELLPPKFYLDPKLSRWKMAWKRVFREEPDPPVLIGVHSLNENIHLILRRMSQRNLLALDMRDADNPQLHFIDLPQLWSPPRNVYIEHAVRLSDHEMVLVAQDGESVLIDLSDLEHPRVGPAHSNGPFMKFAIKLGDRGVLMGGDYHRLHYSSYDENGAVVFSRAFKGNPSQPSTGRSVATAVNYAPGRAIVTDLFGEVSVVYVNGPEDVGIIDVTKLFGRPHGDQHLRPAFVAGPNKIILLSEGDRELGTISEIDIAELEAHIAGK